jgi:hypothetical protein
MANEAVISSTSIIINKLPIKDLMNEAHKRIIKIWQNHWDSIPSSKKLRNIKKPYPNGHIQRTHQGVKITYTCYHPLCHATGITTSHINPSVSHCDGGR